MEKIIEKLASLAEELDSKNLSVHADTVDGVAKTILGVKTAQYVGIQGYWVRNSRCWGNCYRQKRSSNPETPTQEVWAECHEEYTKSIDNDSARKEWDKYAGSDEVTIKTAARVEADSRLNESIDALVSQGSSIGQAVLSAISSQKDVEANFERIIAASQSLVKIAQSIEKTDFELSTRVGKVAQELSKEAQWWNPKDWAAKGVRGLEDAGRAAGNWAQDRGQNQANAALGKAQQNTNYFQQRGQNRGGQPPTASPAPSGGSPAGSNISGPGISGGQGGGMYNPPFGQDGDADTLSPLIQNLSTVLKQIHDASNGDEKQFRSLFNMALKNSGVNLSSKSKSPATPPTGNTVTPPPSPSNGSVSMTGNTPQPGPGGVATTNKPKVPFSGGWPQGTTGNIWGAGVNQPSGGMY